MSRLWRSVLAIRAVFCQYVAALRLPKKNTFRKLNMKGNKMFWLKPIRYFKTNNRAKA